jgi:hypothetical protein
VFLLQGGGMRLNEKDEEELRKLYLELYRIIFPPEVITDKKPLSRRIAYWLAGRFYSVGNRCTRYASGQKQRKREKQLDSNAA